MSNQTSSSFFKINKKIISTNTKQQFIFQTNNKKISLNKVKDVLFQASNFQQKVRNKAQIFQPKTPIERIIAERSQNFIITNKNIQQRDKQLQEILKNKALQIKTSDESSNCFYYIDANEINNFDAFLYLRWLLVDNGLVQKLENQKKIEKMLAKIEELRSQQQQQQFPMTEEEQEQLKNVFKIISEQSLKDQNENINNQNQNQQLKQIEQQQNDQLENLQQQDQQKSQNTQEVQQNSQSSDQDSNLMIDLNEIPGSPIIQKYFTVYEKKPKHRLLLKKQVSTTINQTTENQGISTTGGGETYNNFKRQITIDNITSSKNNQYQSEQLPLNQNFLQNDQQKSTKNDKQLFIKSIQLKKIITDISKNQNTMVKSYSPTGLQNYSMLSQQQPLKSVKKQVGFSQQPSQVMMNSQEFIKSQKASKLQSSQTLQRQKTFQSQLTSRSQKKRNSQFLTSKAVEQLLTKMLISSNTQQKLQSRNKSFSQLQLTPQQSYLNSFQNSPKQSVISLRKSYTFQIPGALIQNNLQEVKMDENYNNNLAEMSCNLQKQQSFVTSSEILSPNLQFQKQQSLEQQHYKLLPMKTAPDKSIILENKKPKNSIVQSSLNLQSTPRQLQQSQLQFQQQSLIQQSNEFLQNSNMGSKLIQQSLIEKLRHLDIKQSIISEKINENDYDAPDLISEENQEKASGSVSISHTNTNSNTNPDINNIREPAKTTALIDLLRLAKQNTTLSQKNTTNTEQKRKSILVNANSQKHKSMNPISVPFKRTSLLLQSQVFNQSSGNQINFSKNVTKINEEIRQSMKRVSFLQSTRLSSKVEFKI